MNNIIKKLFSFGRNFLIIATVFANAITPMEVVDALNNRYSDSSRGCVRVFSHIDGILCFEINSTKFVVEQKENGCVFVDRLVGSIREGMCALHLAPDVITVVEYIEAMMRFTTYEDRKRCFESQGFRKVEGFQHPNVLSHEVLQRGESTILFTQCPTSFSSCN